MIAQSKINHPSVELLSQLKYKNKFQSIFASYLSWKARIKTNKKNPKMYILNLLKHGEAKTLPFVLNLTVWIELFLEPG